MKSSSNALNAHIIGVNMKNMNKTTKQDIKYIYKYEI